MSILENIDRHVRVMNYLQNECYTTDEFEDPDMESNYINMIWIERNSYISEVRNYIIGLKVIPKYKTTYFSKWHISNIELRANYIEYEVRDENGNGRQRYFSWELEIES